MYARIADEASLLVVPLPNAVKEFLAHCEEVARLASNTRTIYKGALGRLIEVCGPGFMTHQLNPAHIQLALTRGRKGETDRQYALRRAANPQAKRQVGRSDGSMNLDNSAYRTFVDWAKAMEYLSRQRTPTYKVKNAPRGKIDTERRERRWQLPHNQRENLLYMAGLRHPRDRFEVALGIYGGRRWSDYYDMRISDIDLDAGTFSFVNKKAGGIRVTLPFVIFPEFEFEVRRWLAWLAGELGELDPDWYLVPARVTPQNYARETSNSARMNPDWPVEPRRMAGKDQVDVDIKCALEVIGAPTEWRGMGPHTLRHNCANWLRDVQYWHKEHIQIWLQHSDLRTTDIYLSKNGDVARLLDLYGPGPLAPEQRENLAPTERGAFRRHLELLNFEDDDAA